MVSVHWVWANVYSDKGPNLSYVLGEVRELLEARSWDEIHDECSDVFCMGQVWLYLRLGKRVNWPFVVGTRAMRKYLGRFERWEEIFRAEGLVFHRKYLTGGGNPDRLAKVAAALSLARAELEGRKA